MANRRTLQEQLGLSRQWVRDEWSFVSDLMAELGCAGSDESGPGRCFRLCGVRVVRVHPKRGHLALGFPEFLRADVDALNAVPRAQKDAVWLTYEPGGCDRDTVEGLVSRAASAASSTSTTTLKSSAGGVTRPAPVDVDVEPVELVLSAESRDQVDLALVLRVLRAHEQHEAAGGGRPAVRALRETLFFVWEQPRLPRGGKRSRHLPHSPAARTWRSAGREDGLVYEHVMPISLVIRQLLASVPADVAALRAVLDTATDRVIVTKAEDDALNTQGMRNAVPLTGDPWSRYERIGLRRSDFRPMEPTPAR